MPENETAAAMFLAAQTQWRHAGMGGRTGLDYAGLDVVMRLHGVEDVRDTFQRVQILERELLSIDREKAKDDGA